MGQTFKLLALGDSVMWGQGLAAGHRFVDLVASYIASTGRQVELASLAHSGAVVCTAPTAGRATRIGCSASCRGRSRASRAS